MKYKETPHDLDAELGIFSIVLNSTDRFLTIVDKLTTTDFYSQAHQQLWQAMTVLFKDGNELDIVSIKAQLKKQEMNAAPAMEAVVQSFENPVYKDNLNHFTQIVKEKSMLRQIIGVTQEGNYSAQLEDADPRVVLTDLEKGILNIVDRSAEARPINATGILSEVQKDLEETKKTGWKAFDTGFYKLDNAIGGLIATQSWIVGAYTGTGKTFFILQLLLNVLRQEGKVVLFSNEMDRKMILLRMMGNIAGVSALDIMRNRILENEVEELNKAQKEIESFKDNLLIYDNVYSLAEMRLKSKKIKLTSGLDIIGVDFIQNMRGGNGGKHGDSIYERMAEAAIGLQQLGQELTATTLIGSQIPQEAAKSKNSQSIDYKGAGEIATIADVGLWITKDKTEKSLRLVDIRKARHAEGGAFHVKLQFPSGRVIPIEQEIRVQDKEDNKSVTEQLKTI